MTIKEISDLRIDEVNKRLRMPIQAKYVENKQELRDVNQAILYLTYSDRRTFLLLVKMFIKGFSGVKSLKGVGFKHCPYEIETSFGSGTFYDYKDCFEGGIVPKDIKHNQCFHNCYLSVTKGYIENCEILSGIAYCGGEGKPFLHSVIKKDNKIIDFNYNVCMDEELYMTLFNFEVLSTIDSQKMLKGYAYVKRYHKVLNSKGLTTMHAVFAWNDIVSMVKNKKCKNVTFEDFKTEEV